MTAEFVLSNGWKDAHWTVFCEMKGKAMVSLLLPTTVKIL